MRQSKKPILIFEQLRLCILPWTIKSTWLWPFYCTTISSKPFSDFIVSFTYLLFIKNIWIFIAVGTRLCILFNINWMYITYILNVSVCVNELILSFLPLSTLYIVDILMLILVLCAGWGTKCPPNTNQPNNFIYFSVVKSNLFVEIFIHLLWNE